MSHSVVTAAGRKLIIVIVLFAVLITASYLHDGSSSAVKSDATDSSAQLLPGMASDAATAAADGMQAVSYTTIRAANQAAVAVYNAINAARRSAHLPRLRWAVGLYRSALVHNVGMARQDMLSHTVANEATFDRRITAQHVPWTNAGENIGWISQLTTPAALAVEAAMLAERAPDNGHRLNILSSTFNTVGVNVIVDSVHKRMWLTEDFTRS